MARLGDPEFHSAKSRQDAWNKILAGSDLKQAKQLALTSKLVDTPIRSLCWKAFLGCVQGDASTWGKQLTAARQNYAALETLHMIDPYKAEVDPSFDNPLSQDENSSWNQFFQNEELQKTINQDIIRTYPETEFFQDNKITSMMLKILFIYAKTTPKLSYRQGMHELLAPIIYLVEHEKVPVSQIDENDPSSLLMSEEFVEHDSYIIFSKLMETAGKWFGVKSDDGHDDSQHILRKCNYIQQVLLKEKDPQLYTYLEDVKVEPQLYLLRWVRLLIGREFSLHELLTLWDALFAFGEGLLLLDYLCVSMLMYIRTQLLRMDQSSCLRRLMKYPTVENAAFFIERAIELTEKKEYIAYFVRAPQHAVQQPMLTTSPNSQTPASPAPPPRRQVDPLAALLENIPETVNELKYEVIKHRRVQYHLSKRLERITFIFQQQIISASSNQSQEDLDASLLALAELKQVKDILAGLLPDEEEEAIVNPMRPATPATPPSNLTIN